MTGLLLTLAVLPAAHAFEIGDHAIPVTIDNTFASKYLWRGYDVYDDHAAYQPSIDVGLLDLEDYGSFGVNVWGSFSLSSGFEDLDELDYTAYYSNSFFEEEFYAMDVGLAFVYYDFPNTGSEADYFEEQFSIALPNLIPIDRIIPIEGSSLVPSYLVAYSEPAESGGPERGWWHQFALAYDIPIPTLIPSQEEQYLSLGWDIWYQDGVFGLDPGFHHTMVTASTSFEIPAGPVTFYISPMVGYQFALEHGEDDFESGRTVNHEDEFVAAISTGFTF